MRDVRTRKSNRPLVLIAETVKGKGVESMSNSPLNHGIAPKGETAKQAVAELERSLINE